MPTRLDRRNMERVAVRVGRLRPDSVRQWGRMTPHQAICHLNDSFKLALDERPIPSARWRMKPLVKFMALQVPLRWPRGRLQTLPEAEQGIGGTPPTEFETDRRELLALMSRFCSAAAGQYCRTHPIFGPMSGRNWRRWAYLHMDHHLRQFSV